MYKEVLSLLDEINHRLRISEDEVLDVESYKPGSRRLYRIVVRRKKDGSIIPWSEWLSYSELRAALQLAMRLLRYMDSHK